MEFKQEWQADAVKLLKTGVMSRREIAVFLGIKRSTCLDFLRKYSSVLSAVEVGVREAVTAMTNKQLENLVRPEKLAYDSSRILVISDLHTPYNHPKALAFLQGLKDKYNPTMICSVGDEQDVHASSFHSSDPDLMSSGDEIKATQKFMKQLEQMFPEMHLMSSNHGDLFYRRAKHHGLPSHVMKSYNEVLGVGEGWKWHSDMIINLPNGKDVYMCHGKSQNGLKLSQSLGMSVIQGHYHNSFNIQYWSSPKDLHWSLQVGCMVDDKSLAMAYNKLTVHRPVIGCAVIIDGVPILEAMPM